MNLLLLSSGKDACRSFDGVWTNASGTRLERPQTYSQLVVSKAEADAFCARLKAAGKSCFTR